MDGRIEYVIIGGCAFSLIGAIFLMLKGFGVI